MSQVTKNWPRGPRQYSAEGELWVAGDLVVANPASRFGVQHVDKLRAVDDLKESSTNEAAFVKTPIDVPSWEHIAQTRALLESGGESRPLAVAKANHADAFKQLPLLREGEMAAVVTLRSPAAGPRYGFIPPQLFPLTAVSPAR